MVASCCTITEGVVFVARYVKKERLIIDGVVPNFRCRVKERLKTGGIVRIAGYVVQKRLRTEGQVVDSSDPTMMRSKFKIARWFALAQRTK
jgi:hypothetical protein